MHACMSCLRHPCAFVCNGHEDSREVQASASECGRAACLQSAPPGLASWGDARQPHAAEQPGRRSPPVPTSGTSVRVLPARVVPATDVRPGVPPGPWEHPPRGRRCAYSRPPCLSVPGFPVRTSASVQSAIVECTAVDCTHTYVEPYAYTSVWCVGSGLVEGSKDLREAPHMRLARGC